jgi:methionine synthase II (cobalamin-independent)
VKRSFAPVRPHRPVDTERAATQRAHLKLPLLPTTAIGPFPQTDELRAARAGLRAGRIDTAGYEERIRAEIGEVVTMPAWSYVRDDQPLGDTARQVALALRDEVNDLEGCPRVPGADEAAALLRKGLKAIPAERLWVDPDCGLKTRGWPETRASPENLVSAARTVRAELPVS